ncbi:three-Cys-motif partner protein TcmP [Variovorax sp. AFSI2.2]|uniref:three-Cys-motif partner protein TcmP n=1 Tax=Variovorax sp. AFSI2.2 TaxID=3384160 RepID=UPI003EB8C7B5
MDIDANSEDVVEGAAKELLESEKLKTAFKADVGFELQNLITALAVLSQAQRSGFDDELSLSYAAAPERIVQVLVESIDRLEPEEAKNIVSFLTLSEKGVLRLFGRDVDEAEVPYWEHSKRTHRYAIRPLVVDGAQLRWGAEATSRSMYNWMSPVRDGYLPADFDWPNVEPLIREVKEGIEKRLEIRTKDIFDRHTPFVERGVDFYRRFRSERFDDVGDFDVFAYWPEENLLVTGECKYNQPTYTAKDGRRLRDRIFGKSESDRAGQFSRILGRRQFLEKNRSKLLELLRWPIPEGKPARHLELYVSRNVYYWMVHPPYPVPTKFVRVDTRMLIGDIEGKRAQANELRLAAVGASVQSFTGPALQTVDAMIKAVPFGSLVLAYIDPYNLEYLSFSIIERLAKLQYVDFAVHFSLMDLTRNIDMELNPKRDRFDHALPGWRASVPADALSKSSLPGWFFTAWCQAVEALGFTVSGQMPLITDGKGRSIYRLVFFSRHSLPDRIWGDIARSRNFNLF